MYLLHRYKGVKPSEYKQMKNGEKRILRAFMEIELDERYEEKKSLYGRG